MKMELTPNDRAKLTPPQLAALWGIDPGKIIGWIRSGELSAIDASTSRGQRPRYLIDRSAIAAFEQRRAIVPPASPAPRQRRSAASGVVEFF